MLGCAREKLKGIRARPHRVLEAMELSLDCTLVRSHWKSLSWVTPQQSLLSIKTNKKKNLWAYFRGIFLRHLDLNLKPLHNQVAQSCQFGLTSSPIPLFITPALPQPWSPHLQPCPSFTFPMAVRQICL